MIRNNLFELFRSYSKSSLCELIVHLKEPRFTDSEELKIPNLTDDQRSAVSKALSAIDYTLLLGFPGTGKTTTIVEIVKQLLSRGKTILLTSYTNSAVDNMLLKLMDYGIDFVRLGSKTKMHAQIASKMAAAKSNVSRFSDLCGYYNNASIVATTALSLNHAIFFKRTFDVCIVDEASQMALPVCLGPLQFAHSFILVGDNYQLPPLVF
jgi:DNA replication ATP-dependent helicase Dna2